MPHRVATRCRQWVPGTSPGTTTVCVLAAKAAKLRCASKYARRPLRLRTRLAYHRDMTVDPSFALVGALIGVPARANMMAALMDGRAQTASELAFVAGVTPQTASSHLAKLIDAGLLAVERQGRHRYYRLAGPAVEEALERSEEHTSELQ